jgi:hypothetical protein
MRTLCILSALLALSAVSAHASDSEVAKQCQAMAEKAHPKSLPNTPAVANLRDNYYDLCMQRRGSMDSLLHSE